MCYVHQVSQPLRRPAENVRALVVLFAHHDCAEMQHLARKSEYQSICIVLCFRRESRVDQDFRLLHHSPD